MSNIEIVIGSAQADKIQAKLWDHPKLPKLKIDRLSSKAESVLLKTPIIVFIDKGKLGKSREISEEDLLTLLEHAKFFSNKHLPAYLSNISSNILSDILLTVIFVRYQNDIPLADHLSNILFFTDKIQDGSTTGKIDYVHLENELKKTLPKGKSLSEFIPNARRHSYKRVLGISIRKPKDNRRKNHESN